MTALHILAAVLFAAFAVSYGWGMRGCIIGGEKGALVPGALLGLSVSLFCCNGNIKDLWPFFCAAGALGMSFGGIEPYAQTMSFILHRDDREEYKGHVMKGAVGIFLKGALWFGIAGIILGMLPDALAGQYGTFETAYVFILIPAVSLVGTTIFNTPYEKEHGIFPKLYFSTSSREEWGGNLLVLLWLVFFCIRKKNYFALGSSLFGLISGGIGFLLGLLIYDFVNRKHNGKYLFGDNGRRFIDGWKIMEHTFGALGGAGVCLWFCLNSEAVEFAAACARLKALPFSGEKDLIGAVAVVAMLFLTAVQYPVKKMLKNGNKEPDEHVFELIERPLWTAFPLIFIFLGSQKAAVASAFLTIAYALCEKCGIEWFSRYKGRRPVQITMAVFLVICTVYYFVRPDMPVIVPAVLYTACYTAMTLWYFLMPEKIREFKKSEKGVVYSLGSAVTVGGNFAFQSIVIIAVTAAVL